MVQLQVINYLLSSKNVPFLDKLDERYFDEYKDEFNYIKSHCEQYGNIPDRNTFINDFEDFEIISVNETPDYLLDQLKKDKKRTDIISSYNKIHDMLVSDDIDGAFDYIQTIDIKDESKDLIYTNLLDPSERFESYLDRCENKEKYFIPTGFKELDNLIGGWDANEEYAVIVARPSVGKSQIAIKCATAAVEKGLIVGFYSGEMSKNKVGYRVDTMFANIPNYDLTRGDRKSELIYRKYIQELPTKYEGKFWLLTAEDIKRAATVSDLRRFIKDKNLDILFIDQLSLLEDQRHGKTDIEKFSNLSKDIKLLQTEVRKPMIVLSQQHRGSTEDEDVFDVSHIAQADRIGEDASTVLFLEPSKDNSMLHIHISKSRDAERGKKLSYHICWNLGTFDYVPSENENNNSQNNRNDYQEDDYTEGAPF